MTQRISHDEKMLFSWAASVCPKQVLVVRGKTSFYKSGAIELITQLQNEISCKITHFFDFSANPKSEDVEKGVCLAKTTCPDSIIAIGGGSVIDMAKLIRYGYQENIPLIAIPTTAGTGAESTHFAVCFINGIKYSIADNKMLPDEVFLIPRLCYQNPAYLTACSGFDALAQATESYWNMYTTPESDHLALEAIRHIVPVLESAVTGQGYQQWARAQMLTGANLAGQAINITKTTVPHALSYTLTSTYNYPHGHAVALSFPFYLRYYLNSTNSLFLGKDHRVYLVKKKKLADVLGVSSTTAYSTLKAFLRKIGLGYDPARPFDTETVVQGMNLERAKNFPLVITEDIVRESVESMRE